MKKSFIIFVLLLSLTGCKKNDIRLDEQDKNSDSATTQVVTDDAVDADHLSEDNIQIIDLNMPENSDYLQYRTEFTYGNEYSLPDGRKIIEDKNIYIQDLSGNKVTVIEISEEETEKYAVFWNMIDDNRFCYYIVNHETTGGSGIYNLETGEDFRIDVCEDHSAYVPKTIVNNYLYFTRGFIDSFKGIGRLDLDTYEFTEIDFSHLFENNIYYSGESDISPDGTKIALYRMVSRASEPNGMNEYQVTIYSLDNDKILQSYNFFSENEYVNYQLLYYSENQVYLYASQYGDNPKDHLYIINIG